MSSHNIEYPYTENYSVSCPKCRYVQPSIRTLAAYYFENNYILCNQCNALIDLWKVAIERIRALSFAPWFLQTLGASATSIKFELSPNVTKKISLTEQGIPEDATILAINYTPQGHSAFPMEFHGNNPQHRIINRTITLFGIPIEGGAPSCPVFMNVVWVHKEESIGWTYLVDALEAAATQNYSRVLAPAQIRCRSKPNADYFYTSEKICVSTKC